MSHPVLVELQMPEELEGFRLPGALDRRLHDLLDRQDAGQVLTDAEREEAEALVNMAETLSLLQLRAETASRAV